MKSPPRLSKTKRAAPSLSSSPLTFKTRRVHLGPTLGPMRMVSLAMCLKRCEWIRGNADVRLAPEVAHVRPWWSWLGGGAGATIGYIVANVPGAVAGGESWRSNAEIRLCGKSAGSCSGCQGQERRSGLYWIAEFSKGRGELCGGKGLMIDITRAGVQGVG